MRFSRRADSVTVRDTAREPTPSTPLPSAFNSWPATPRSPGCRLQLYRLPAAIDSTTTYAAVDPAFVPANLMATIDVPDSLKRGTDPHRVSRGRSRPGRRFRRRIAGCWPWASASMPPTPTGVRLGAAAAATAGVFVTYATLDVPDTGTAKLRTFTLSRHLQLLRQPVPQPCSIRPCWLSAGEPSSRAMLRFALPPHIRDSATIVRATLELTPVAPIIGLAHRSGAAAGATRVLADLGAKSPVNSAAGRVPADTIETGATSVNLEAVPAGASCGSGPPRVRPRWCWPWRPISRPPASPVRSFIRPGPPTPRYGRGFGSVICAPSPSRIPECDEPTSWSCSPCRRASYRRSRPSSACADWVSRTRAGRPCALEAREPSVCSIRSRV